MIGVNTIENGIFLENDSVVPIENGTSKENGISQENDRCCYHRKRDF